MSTPNVFVEFDWTGSAYELTFEYGTTITTQNTESLAVFNETDDSTIYWVSQDEDAREEFPLEPGASITVEADEDADLSMVWSTVDRSVVVDARRAEETNESSAETTENQ